MCHINNTEGYQNLQENFYPYHLTSYIEPKKQLILKLLQSIQGKIQQINMLQVELEDVRQKLVYFLIFCILRFFNAHTGKTKLPLSTDLIHIHKMFVLKSGEKKIYIKSQSEQSEIEQMMFLSLPLTAINNLLRKKDRLKMVLIFYLKN